MFETRNIILFILVIITIFLIYKTNSVENFESTDVNTIINNNYAGDIDAIRNLAGVANYIYNNNDNDIIMPGTVTDVNNIIINGNVTFTNTNPNMLDYLPDYSVIMWNDTDTNIPTGWLLCDGTYNTPDLRGRFILGEGLGIKSNLTNRIFMSTGGEETVQLSSVPSHNHTITVYLSDNDLHTGSGTDSNGNQMKSGLAKNEVPGITGTAIPHSNMPPYHVLNYIMKKPTPPPPTTTTIPTTTTTRIPASFTQFTGECSVNSITDSSYPDYFTSTDSNDYSNCASICSNANGCQAYMLYEGDGIETDNTCYIFSSIGDNLKDNLSSNFTHYEGFPKSNSLGKINCTIIDPDNPITCYVKNPITTTCPFSA
jgi:hypothetical protein